MVTNLKVSAIKIQKPLFDPHPEKSLTNNHDWRQGLLVFFKDNQGKEFVWMPRWDEVASINNLKSEVERINSELAREKWLEQTGNL